MVVCGNEKQESVGVDKISLAHVFGCSQLIVGSVGFYIGVNEEAAR
jgi:hypothetical protein